MPTLADPSALQHDMVDTVRGETSAHGKAGLAATDDDDIWISHDSCLWIGDEAGRHIKRDGRADQAGGRGLDADRNRHAVGDDVEHGRSGLRLHDDLLESIGSSVTIDLEGNLDALVAVADVFRESENATQIDITLDRRLDFVELDSAHRRDIGDASGETRGECMQNPLRRCGPGIGATEDSGMIA